MCRSPAARCVPEIRARRSPASSRGPLLRLRTIRDRAVELISRYRIAAPGPDAQARQLSGGNLQKVVLAREFTAEPRLIVAAAPTRGLDVGAIEYLHRRLVEERDEGRAILLVSLELDEILSLSDRILVIYEGEIVGEHGADASEEAIGMEMLGAKREDAA